MQEIETVGIRSFGDAVSSFIRKASLGVRILISDRGRVVAELRKAGSGDDRGSSLLQTWEAQGKIVIGNKGKFKFPKGNPILIYDTTEKVLDELRGN